jgi:SAM-dependent methyltransferase
MTISTRTDTVIEQNRRAWNEVAPRHAEQNFEDTRRRLATSPGHYIDPVFREHLRSLGLGGKVLAQFNCNNGRELLSAIQLGARGGLGFDFSAEFVGQARRLTEAARVKAEFVETDIYEIPSRYDASADLLFLTAGALCWMPDLHGYFDAVRRVVRPGGQVVLYETHPFLEMFKPDRDRRPDEPLELHYPYFMHEPVAWDSGLDYYSGRKYGREQVYWYHYTLSDIFQAVIDSGLRISRFAEFGHDNSIGYREAERFTVRPPMSFILSCERP